jgi:hypothetical protein
LFLLKKAKTPPNKIDFPFTNPVLKHGAIHTGIQHAQNNRTQVNSQQPPIPVLFKGRHLKSIEGDPVSKTGINPDLVMLVIEDVKSIAALSRRKFNEFSG